ncbi:ATP-dependent zinc metalloprotease FtsH [Mariniblastus sp.]|nr:ATP-dependent zinc metalloprotease FtsH [Mariniblastus sp.]
MDNPSDSQRDQEENQGRSGRGFSWVFPALFIFLIAFLLLTIFTSTPRSEIEYKDFLNFVQGKDQNGKVVRDDNDQEYDTLIEYVDFGPYSATGKFKAKIPEQPKYNRRTGTLDTPAKGKKLEDFFSVNLGGPDSPDRKEALAAVQKAGVKSIDIDPQSNAAAWYYGMFLALTFGILMFMMISMRRSQNQMMGGGGFLSSFSRSPAKRYEASDKPITFKDVAGLEGVKADLGEIVEFLKDPTRFQKLGGRVPKGALLIGPPGTGKTLLARAIAGEAGVPYFSVNGSEFIQMFVGVGASRVRDLFATAKAQSPAIIFVDEIDAVGRQRGAGVGGGHDEREQTLNQILGEMDGFEVNDAVIVVAATNRPDILDPALLRPGRFDRHVTVSRPTKRGRLAIFKVHVRDVPLAADVDLDIMAQATVGMTGADIQNLVNEAALWAARSDKSAVEMEDFYYAHDKVLMGAKREEILSVEEKEKTAYHEAGHTLTAWRLKGASPVHKVTVIPRGRALGVTQMVPDEDRMNMSENDILDNLVVLLGGRAAEKLIYSELSVGAENDLERATSMARRMVTHWGMSEKLGPVSYKTSDEDPFLGGQIHKTSQFSEHTLETIDEEVHSILTMAAKRALDMLIEHKADLEAITKGLMQHEELDRKQITELIGDSVHATRLKAREEADALKQAKADAEKKAEPEAEKEADAETDAKLEAKSDS